MRSDDTPSAPQALLLARLWGENRPVRIMVKGRDGAKPYVPPTHLACLKRGWLHKDGISHFENGFEFMPCAVSPSGLLAIERFLMAERFKKKFG